MQLRLYDTLTKEKRPFTPIDPANVRMYVCGPTVYDFAHIGNARPVDRVRRAVPRCCGISMATEHVNYVRNITDVDDKINARAARDFPGLPLNEAIRKVTELTEKQFHDDVDALGCLRADGRAARDRAYPRDARDHREAGRRRLCLCRRGPRAVLAAGDERGEFGAAALWRARPTARSTR